MCTNTWTSYQFFTLLGNSIRAEEMLCIAYHCQKLENDGIGRAELWYLIIRDGEQITKWEILQKPVLTTDNSSPLQWKNRGKVVAAEAETIYCDNSLNQQSNCYLHMIINTDCWIRWCGSAKANLNQCCCSILPALIIEFLLFNWCLNHIGLKLDGICLVHVP